MDIEIEDSSSERSVDSAGGDGMGVGVELER